MEIKKIKKIKKKGRQYLRKDEQDESMLSKDKLKDGQSLLYLLRFTKGARGPLILALGLILINALCMVAMARVTGSLVEEGLIAANKALAWKYACVILLLLGGDLICFWMSRKILARVATFTLLEIRKALFLHLQHLPMSYYDRQPQGRIITRLTHDVEGMENFFTSSFARLADACFLGVISIAAMVWTDLALGSMVASWAIPAFLFVLLTRDRARFFNRRISRASSACNARLSEYVDGLEVIRSLGLEDWTKRQYDGLVDEHQKAQLTANSFFSWSRPLMTFLCALPLIAFVWMGGHAVLASTLSVGIFVAFVGYCERFFHPIMTLAQEFHIIQQAFTSAERVALFLKESTENEVLGRDGPLDGRKMPSLQGLVRFENVSMAYEAPHWIVKDLNFTIEKGEKIGMVGATGSGKTTTISLLLRLYEFQKGTISLDGHSIRDYSRSFLRDHIGLVSQDVVLFRGTLRENLSFGGKDERMADQHIIECCRETGLLQVMEHSSLHLDSEVLENGANLSAGERQLLSLTRILLKNPSILILDEATAHIDSHHERIVHRGIERVMKGRTCLIVAHRLETLKNCDRIFVFDRGHIKEQGTSRQLMEQGGHFYRLQTSL